MSKTKWFIETSGFQIGNPHSTRESAEKALFKLQRDRGYRGAKIAHGSQIARIEAHVAEAKTYQASYPIREFLRWA